MSSATINNHPNNTNSSREITARLNFDDSKKINSQGSYVAFIGDIFAFYFQYNIHRPKLGDEIHCLSTVTFPDFRIEEDRIPTNNIPTNKLLIPSDNLFLMHLSTAPNHKSTSPVPKHPRLVLDARRKYRIVGNFAPNTYLTICNQMHFDLVQNLRSKAVEWVQLENPKLLFVSEQNLSPSLPAPKKIAPARQDPPPNKPSTPGPATTSASHSNSGEQRLEPFRKTKAFEAFRLGKDLLNQIGAHQRLWHVTKQYEKVIHRESNVKSN